MASRRGPAYWVGLCVGWLLVAGWVALVALNAAPFLRGAAPPPLSELLTQLVTPPGLPLPPDLASLAGWTLAAVALAAGVVLAALTFSPPVAAPARPLLAPPAVMPPPEPDTHALAPLLTEAAPAQAPPVAPVEQAPVVAAPTHDVAEVIAPAIEAASMATPEAAPEAKPATATTKRPRVFISHASHDNDFGAQLVERMRTYFEPEYEVWYDSMGGPGEHGLWEGGIPPATYFQDEIQARLMEADVFVVILSPASMTSPWVADELRLAWSRKNYVEDGKAALVVVPILRETCEIPPWLAQVQWVDFTGWRAAGWPTGARTWAALISAVIDTRTRMVPV